MISEHIRGSLIKFCQGIILDLNDKGLTGFNFVDWDAHADLHEIPEQDLLGLSALGWSEDENVCEIVFAVGVSTLNDVNLFRSWKAVGTAFEKMRPQKTIPLYNSNTTDLIDQMVIQSGTTVSPVSRAEVRPFQFVQASLLLELDSSLL